MSIDRLQANIRKLKNPSIVDFTADAAQIPPHILEQESDFTNAYGRFCAELLSALRDRVPAVRFSLNMFALMDNGLKLLSELTQLARDFGFYVFVDAPLSLSLQQAEMAAEHIFSKNCDFYFDGIIISTYIGSDGLRPYVQQLVGGDQMLVAVVRTANKTAPELQDLLTGSRHVHHAMADIANRYTDANRGRSGYSNIAFLTAANAAESIRNLRTKQKNVFLFIDGYDAPSANAKICSMAFDSLGHGAAACAGTSITAAWVADNDTGENYIQLSLDAVERMKKNLCRYIDIL